MKSIIRKSFAVLIAVMMLCLAVPVSAAVVAADNPIVNGGFEDGKTGWKFNSGTAEIVSDAHSGSKALSLTNPGQWGEAAIQTIAVEANTDYVFTWYAKRVSGSGAFNLYVMNAVGYANVERLAGQNWMNDTAQNWIKYEYTINTGDATSLLLKWSTEAKNPGTILIDDFSIAKVGGDEPATGNIADLLGNIKTQGRTAMINGTLMLDFALSGVEFELDCSGDVYATFNARKLASTSSTGGIYFTVVVDGVKQARDFCRITTGGETKFLLAEDLPAGKHTFAIYRQSEHQYGEIGISALSYDGTILKKPADKDLYIEFIGDSISNGYGILGNYSQGDGSALWSDATQAYNFLTAEALNADFSNPSWSGLGCKYGYSSITMQDVYPAQRYNFDKTTPYAFDREPNIVVLALGTNDNSKGPDTASIRAGLVEMLTLVREKNPNAPIVWIYGMMTNNLNSMIEEIVAEFGGTEAGYYACKLTTNTSGGGYHPNLAGQKKFANELVTFIQANGLDVVPEKPEEPDISGNDTGLISKAETSRMEMSDDALGLAFRYTLNAQGITMNRDHVIDLTDATITVEGTDYKLLQVGAIVTNDVEIGLRASRMTRENLSSKTKDVPAVYANALTEEGLKFAVRVTNIPWEKSDAVIYARCYYVYECAGEEVIVYGDIFGINYDNNLSTNDGVFDW